MNLTSEGKFLSHRDESLGPKVTNSLLTTHTVTVTRMIMNSEKQCYNLYLSTDSYSLK